MHCLFFGNYDLVIVNHIESGFIVPFLRLRYKVICSARGIPQLTDKWSKIEKNIFEIFENLFLKFASVVVSVSKPHIARFEKKTKKQIYYIPNGIYLNEESADDIIEKDYIFFSAARIMGIKGCHIMLEALNEIDYKGRVLIAGGMDHVSSYESQIKKMAATLDVSFLGLLKEKKKVMGYLKNALFFIFPSFTEGMSNMLLEAASMEVPIICSDIPENTAVFSADEVLYFKTGDSSDLAKKVIWALDNKGQMRKFVSKAKKKLTTAYTWDIVAQKYDCLFQELLKEP